MVSTDPIIRKQLMIKVGIHFASQSGWTGGANYFINLINAISLIEKPSIEPVLLIAPSLNSSALARLPKHIRTHKNQIFDSQSLNWKFSKFKQHVIGRDSNLERLLHAEGIKTLSHSGHLGKNSSLITLPWIPDFQHRHMPQFFDAKELSARDARFERLCRNSTFVIVSSQTAADDLANFYPRYADKVKVLRFVADLPEVTGCRDGVGTLNGQPINYPYFYLPNQFWEHKNHEVTIRALSILKGRGISQKIIATGNPRGLKQGAHFESLRALAGTLGVDDDFITPGLVPINEVSSLMRNCLAVINPSKFEGWSTSVEEAKSLGKQIILSDIKVHKEQQPERGFYFDPSSAENLADVMTKVATSFDLAVDSQRVSAAQRELPARINKFALSYQDIILEATPK